MSADISKFGKFIRVALENENGVASEFQLIRTRNLSAETMSGDSKKREYDGGDGRANPTVMSNLHSNLSFDVDFAGSGESGAKPGISHLLQIAGLLEEDIGVGVPEGDQNYGVFQYRPSSARQTPTGAIIFSRKHSSKTADGKARYNQYKSKGCRAKVGISWKVGEDPLFQFSDFIGDYERPITEVLEEIAMVYSHQTDPLPISYDSVQIAKIGDLHDSSKKHSLCLHEFNISNFSGLDITRQDIPNCSSTSSSEVAIEGTVKIKMPDFDDDYNPYELVESHEKINKVPLELELGKVAGNIINLSSSGVQFHTLKEVELSDNTMGLDLSFTALALPTLRFK